VTKTATRAAVLTQGRRPGRAREPDAEGWAVRDGVRLAWSRYGSAGRAPDRPTVLLMPTWSIVDSRVWKAQIGYLSRHFDVITFDGRGCGRSDRPTEARCYADDEFGEDAIAVLDAVGVDVAVLVGLSCGVSYALHAAARHPARVAGLFAIAPACGLGSAHPEREVYAWDRVYDATAGWASYNRDYWRRGGYPDFVEFFMTQFFPEPHSTKQIEDLTGWALEADPQIVIACTDGRLGCDGAVCPSIDAICPTVRCPVVIMHGLDDRIRPIGTARRLAELTGGDLIELEGVGHGPPAREPVLVNAEIRALVERVLPRPVLRTWTRSGSRRPRVLYLSSPIGLGHARRDLAIARELRTRHPEIEIDWLAQDPVTRVLADAGERIHPASGWLANESAHIEAEALDHDLHAFQAIRRMDDILIDNFMVFDDVVAEGGYDLVVGDEAWDVDHFLHENPERKRFAYAWFTDFVGWLPMPDGGAGEAALTADYNAEMLEQRSRFRRLRDRSIFVGQPDDIVAGAFGPGLPEIRSWTERNFDFAGYVTDRPAPTPDDRARLRAAYGYRSDEQVCLVAVGGSGVGEALLRRVLAAVPLARRMAPGLRFVVVAGPRIDPGRLPRPDGADVLGYRADLVDLVAACDVAIVQGGLSTCMELTAAARPFLYVPLRHHFEQNFHVPARLERYRAGVRLDYERAGDPDALVAALVDVLATPVTSRPVETDGAARAAGLLAELL
jgi:pimeloyl-ACP methyl ester carboxylesterase/predicted glycosyltransferase